MSDQNEQSDDDAKQAETMGRVLVAMEKLGDTAEEIAGLCREYATRANKMAAKAGAERKLIVVPKPERRNVERAAVRYHGSE